MNILNCIKTVPDMDKVPDADWASGAAACRCDFSYTPKILDPYCESGAELVLRLMDASAEYAKAGANGDSFTVSADALTIADRLAEKPLRTLAALGYRGVYRISDEAGAIGSACSDTAPSFDPARTARLIAGFCQKKHYDLIVLGMESFDEGSRLVPFYLAELLGYPCISDVTSISPAGEGKGRIRLTHRQAGALITETVSTPLIVTVGDVPSCLLRVPTLRQRSAAARNAVQVTAAEDLDPSLQPGGPGLPANPGQPKNPELPEDPVLLNDLGTQAARILTKDSGHTAAELTQSIRSPVLLRLDVVDQSRRTQRFEGPAEEAAQKILDLCHERGLLL